MKTLLRDLRGMRIRPLLLCIMFVVSTTSFAMAQTPWRFIVVGDTRGTSATNPINSPVLTELAVEIVSQGAAFVLVPGDLIYSGNLSGFQAWKNIMAPVYQAGIGVYPILGNHDANAPAAFIQVFGPDLPDNGPAGEINRTYAFSYNNVLILALDNYAGPNKVNQPWVDGMLAQNTLPHVFTFGHEPAFKANHVDCLDDNPVERDAFWNSLINAGSSTYFCGHDHFYDHLRVDDGDGNLDNDVHQMIVGSGGAPFYTTYAYDGDNTSWTPVGVYHEAQYGYTLVEVDGPKITMTFYHRTGTNSYAASSDVWSYIVSSGPTLPDPPAELIAAAGDSRVTLSWTASSGAITYNVKRAIGGAGTYQTIATGIAGNSYLDLNVTNGSSYDYVVTAVNSVGESANSPVATATPQGAPAVPANLSAKTGSKRGQISLTWNASAGATRYNVQRSNMPGGPYTLVKRVTMPSFADSKLTSGRTYYYVVTASNANGESQPSNEASAVAK